MLVHAIWQLFTGHTGNYLDRNAEMKVGWFLLNLFAFSSIQFEFRFAQVDSVERSLAVVGPEPVVQGDEKVPGLR